MKAVFIERLRREKRQMELLKDPPLANESCPHPAGSIEKIEAMRRRVELGERVFHPNDNSDVLAVGGRRCLSDALSA